jgi:hypothetical protein
MSKISRHDEAVLAQRGVISQYGTCDYVRWLSGSTPDCFRKVLGSNKALTVMFGWVTTRGRQWKKNYDEGPRVHQIIIVK